MSLAAGADDEGPAVNTNLRAQLGRKLRRLERRGRVTFRTTRAADDLDADLTTLFTLHEQRWRSTPGGSRAFAGRAPFHRQFAADALRRGWLRLRFIEVDGVPVSALYNLRYGDAESNYQAGRHPPYARPRPRARRSIGSCAAASSTRNGSPVRTGTTGSSRSRWPGGRSPAPSRSRCDPYRRSLARCAVASRRHTRGVPAVARFGGGRDRRRSPGRRTR
jgi:GNAT acetyltransferase-like protein